MTHTSALRWLRSAATAALLLAVAALIWRFSRFSIEAVQAVGFADELDYGEGIVWQQAEWLFTPRAYGPIDVFPSIVYHYTPFYHLVTRAVSALGIDMLAAGRLVSLGATALIALCVGAIAVKAAEPGASARAKWVMGVGAGLAIFSVTPLIFWASMMRVDMLSIAMGFVGICFVIAALRRPWLIYGAAAAFVLSVFTKQTAVAAPAATFLVLLILRPRLAVRGIAASLLLGAIGLVALTWATDGGFIRHAFLYNINRIELWRLRWMWEVIAIHILFLLVALRLGWPRLRAVRERLKISGRAALDVHDVAWIIASVYALLAWLVSFSIIKSGSSMNYSIEWLCALCVLVGLALSDTARAVDGDARTLLSRDSIFFAITVPLIIAVHCWIINPPSNAYLWRPARIPELDKLAGLVRSAKKPVISDNMVVLLRGGKSVMWEPAIFAELAHAGFWNEGPFVQRIRRGEFGFIVTVRNRGDRLFDSRYNPAVADAIDAAYPKTRVLAGYTLHMPADQADAFDRMNR